MKPEWWGSPLVQEEKYQEKGKPVIRAVPGKGKTCDKSSTRKRENL
jgi:hypothetical protein